MLVENAKSGFEILKETVEYYEADPSRWGMDEYNQCQYLTEDGKMCAVGRCCIAPETLKLAGSVSHLDIVDIKLEEALKPEYRGQSPGFWVLLQYYHDRWNDVSERKSYVEMLLEILRAEGEIVDFNLTYLIK